MQSHSVLLKSIVWGIVGAGLMLPADIYAQGNRAERRDIFEGLLKSLIESQTDQLSTPPQERTIRPNQRISPQVTQVQRIIRDFTTETDTLFDLLADYSVQNLSVRTHLSSLLKVKADAAVLSRQAEYAFDLETMRDEVVTLDKDWRLVSHKLQEIPGLSNAVKSSIQRADQLDRQLTEVFGIQPQIDSQEFRRLTDSLEVGLQNLFEDIAIEFGRTKETRDLLVQGRLIEQQVSYMADAIARQQSRELAVKEFQKFHQLWGPFASQLWPLHNRYVERSLQRIEQVDRQLHEILWLPIPTDNRQFDRLAKVLNTDVETLLNQVTLSDLMKMRDSTEIVKTSRDFYQATDRLLKSISNKADLVQLQRDFTPVENNWLRLQDSFQTSTNTELLRLLKSTDQTIISLRQALKINAAFDRQEALDLFASLENYGQHLQDQFSTEVLVSGRYDRRFAFQGLHTCQQFTAFAHNLHEDMAAGAKPEDLKERCDTLARGWTYLNQEYINKLQGIERQRLARLSTQVTPLIVSMQTMFNLN